MSTHIHTCPHIHSSPSSLYRLSRPRSKHLPPLPGPLRWLWQATQMGQLASISFSVFTPTNNAYDDMATYSSYGPTPDGRFKVREP